MAGSDAHAEAQARFVHALRTQAKTADALLPDALPCPFCSHQGRLFQNLDQLLQHAELEHALILRAMDPSQTRVSVRDMALKLKAMSDQSSEATAGGSSMLDLSALSLLDIGKARTPCYSAKKRTADTEMHARRTKAQCPVEIYDPNFSRSIPHTIRPERTCSKKIPQSSPYPFRSTPEPSSEWSVEANRSQFEHSRSRQPSRPVVTSPSGTTQSCSVKPRHYSTPQPRPGGLEIHRFDSRFPSLLLQPDSRPISQEQLASEVKSIYAGLTMVETKCIHVDRAQAAALAQADADHNSRLSSEHWQALIALHRTLLHEHHDFFLASQHPSASPALRRLAGKYSMPARMWKHGIHSFLEMFRRRLPESIDYMLAFIYLAYQMMALLYETVPAFEDTWIECLGDLGRYRMAIEDEDCRDRETWAGVARSWYSTAADKNPNMGRLYHHLAILARPNALQQLYYYSQSLTCVAPLDARMSILTLLDPILGKPSAPHSWVLPIDTRFIEAHEIPFERVSALKSEDAYQVFQSQLDNHIGRITAKWKEQGVYNAVTNIGCLFDYASDVSNLQRPTNNMILPTNMGTENPLELTTVRGEFGFSRSFLLTTDTIALCLKRIGDKNVLPHVHAMVAFIRSFVDVSIITSRLEAAPWTELCTFLNTLLKSEQQHNIESSSAIPLDTTDNFPLPEDYLIRGNLWTQLYFPETWFSCDHVKEDLYNKENILDVEQERFFLRAFHNLRASLLSKVSSIKERRWSHPLRFMSLPLALHILIPGVAAQSVDTTTNPNWRQRAIDSLSEILVKGAVLVAPTIILVIIGSIAVALLWAEAEGMLGAFMLIMAIVLTAIRPSADSTAKESDHYIRLAVGLGYIMLMLAYCRVITMQPKHKKTSNSRRRMHRHGKIFCTIATTLGTTVTVLTMAFPGSRDYWKALTGSNPIFALFLATPLSFFLCDLVSNVARVINLHEDEEDEETAMFSQLSQLEAGESSAFALQDMSTRRFPQPVQGEPVQRS